LRDFASGGPFSVARGKGGKGAPKERISLGNLSGFVRQTAHCSCAGEDLAPVFRALFKRVGGSCLAAAPLSVDEGRFGSRIAEPHREQ
jgi:hypothetical protein